MTSELGSEPIALNVNKIVQKSVDLSQVKPVLFRYKFRFNFRFLPPLQLMPPVPFPQRRLSRSSAAFACFKLSLSCLSIAAKFAASLSKPRKAVMDSICD